MAGNGSRWRTMWDKASHRVILVVYLIRAVPWRAVRRLHDRRAPIVVWIPHRYPSSIITYLAREDTLVKDAGLVNALCERNVGFRLVFGRRIERVRDRDVVYTIHPYNPDRVQDYSVGLMMGLARVEANGNHLFPGSSEAEWWENKVFMHHRFAELGIHCPETTIQDLSVPVDVAAFDYPLLVKEPHSSGSRGLHKVASAGELQRLVDQLVARGEPDLLIQKLVDMRRDFRATVIDGRVVHSYFRINTGEAWKPTSTSHGSMVDFESFPEQWRAYITDTFSKLGLHAGAFDLCWAGDDLTTEPIVLEVSPSFTPNPPPPEGWTKPYYEFKSVMFGEDSFPQAQIATVFGIAGMLIDSYGIAASARG